MSAPLQNNNTYIVIPAYNEGDVLPRVIKELSGQGYSVVVVDDGSHPSYSKLIRSVSGVFKLKHRVNLGQGAALQTGIDFAVKKKAAFIVTFDADGQHAVADLPALLKPLENKEADISMGSRFLKPGSHNASFLRRLFLQAGRFINFLFTGFYLSDAHNGLRAMTVSAAQKIKLKENRMAHATEFLLAIKKNRLNWKEVPVTIAYTDYSRKKGQSVFNSIRIFFDLVLHKLFE